MRLQTSIFLLFFAALLITQSAVAQQSTKLEKIHRQILENFAEVDHLTPDELANTDREIVLFDVRQPDEYGVSRLDGAIQIAPDITRVEFLAQFGEQIKGRKAIFYCSVGRRSSELISRVQDDLYQQGASEVYNLKGGIFNWHNQERHLVDNSGKTDYVHPYNFWWKRSLDRSDFARYKPGKTDHSLSY